jgi:hypothetical protein
MKFVKPEAIPFMIVWKELVVVASMLEVMIDEVDVTPFTTDVSTFAAAESEFEFTKLAVVVAVTPFTIDVSTKLFVVVDMVRVCEVPAFMRAWRSVLVATPLMMVVRTVPDAAS